MVCLLSQSIRVCSSLRLPVQNATHPSSLSASSASAENGRPAQSAWFLPSQSVKRRSTQSVRPLGVTQARTVSGSFWFFGGMGFGWWVFG
jgi:hypothetical protein